MAKKETAISKKVISVMDITNVDPKALKEFKGWEKSQLDLVKDNPFVEVTDHKSYTLAKKHRTALRTGRTSLQKQDKEVAKKLQEFRKSIGSATEDLIQITVEAEVTQQEEIKLYEAKKEAEAKAKEEAEQKRIDDLLRECADIILEGGKIVKNMTFETIEGHRAMFNEFCDGIDMKYFNEPALNFNFSFSELDNHFENTVKALQKAEAERIRLEELKAKEEAMKKEEERLEAERKAMAKAKAEAKKKEEEMKRREMMADARDLQNEQRQFLIESGYEENPTHVWKYKGNMISTLILNAEIRPVLGFATLEELKQNVNDHFKLLHDQAVAKQIKEKKEAEAKEKAQKKIDDALAEVKMEEIKEQVNEGLKTIKEIAVGDIDVNEPYIFPTDLGIDSDIEAVMDVMKKISQIMQSDVTFKTEQIHLIWDNFNKDLGSVFDQYIGSLEAIQKAKSIAE